MRYLYLVILYFWALAYQQVNAQPHLDIARKYIGTVELTGHNDGRNVEMFLRSVKLKKGSSWCGAFVGFCLTEAKAKTPKTRSGLARAYKTSKSIKSKDVLIGIKKVPNGSILIFEKGNTIYGHTGFVIKWNGKSGKTIEGNTSSGLKGSQDNGDGVYIKTRYIQPLNYFRITSFTLVTY